MCAPVQMQRQQVKNNPGTFRRRDDINVIEVGQQTLVRTQLAAHLGEGRMLTQGEQSRHQRVALFAAFRLRNQVGLAVSVMPHKPGGVRVELAHERQAHIGAGSAGQGLQHGLSAANAPTPSTDRMVASGRDSVATRRAWATASVPARVDKAN